MLSDNRYKELMESVGMPNSRSLLLALQQAVHETVMLTKNLYESTDEIETQQELENELIDKLSKEYKCKTEIIIKLIELYRNRVDDEKLVFFKGFIRDLNEIVCIRNIYTVKVEEPNLTISLPNITVTLPKLPDVGVTFGIQNLSDSVIIKREA